MKRLLLIAIIVAGCGYGMEQPGRSAHVQGSCRITSQPVQWVLPEEQRPVLDAWCGAVGPPLLLAASAPPGEALLPHAEAGGPRAEWSTPSAATAVDSLLVVTWNVHVGGGDLRRFIADVRSGAVTGGGPVAHFAVLLQETYRGGPVVPAVRPGAVAPRRVVQLTPAGTRDPVDRLTRELDLHAVYIPSMRNGDEGGDAAEDRGGAILATLPLAAPLAVELPAERQRRVAVAGAVRGVTSRGREWSLQLVSVHLENRVALDVDGLLGMPGVAARARQIDWLLERLPAARHAVLGGDLNTWVSEEAEPAATKALARYPDTPPLPAGPTHASHGIFRGRLDYLFGRVPGGAMRGYQRAPHAYGSDHFPLFAWIVFPAQ